MTDLLLEAWVSGLIEAAKLRWILGYGRPWKPGQKLKLLFAGYNGTRNTGSDVRVEEMLRQVRQILGAENTEFTVMSQNFDFTQGYFGDARQVRLPDVFPPFLQREVPRHHGVIACEGSMFKSKFANALTAMMIGSLGIAVAQNKLAVGYGAEAGEMDGVLRGMCKRFCSDALIITRNQESREILASLGIRTELGTDTAWTFAPEPVEYGRRILCEHGWDGTTPILAICPIHPFWWPVKASIGKTAAHALTGAYHESHYRSLYFHRSGRAVAEAYARYLDGIAEAVLSYRKERVIFPVAIAMERLDSQACADLAARLGGLPVFASDKYNMYELVSLLRCANRLISSRYHAIVTSMPAAVPSAGVTMDERIRNLMRDRGQTQLLLEAGDPDLAEKLRHILCMMDAHEEEIRDGICMTVARNLKVMARMGVYLEECVARIYPQFPLRRGPLGWEDYLPRLSSPLQKLAESYT